MIFDLNFVKQLVHPLYNAWMLFLDICRFGWIVFQMVNLARRSTDFSGIEFLFKREIRLSHGEESASTYLVERRTRHSRLYAAVRGNVGVLSGAP